MSKELFLLSLADVFSIYPKNFKELLLEEEQKRRREGTLAKDFLYLPSDKEWQDKVYYRLLEIQKRVNRAIESGMTFEEVTKVAEKPVWDSVRVFQNVSPITSPTTGFSLKKKKCAVDHPITFIDITVLGCWTLENIAKAGKLLRKPPIPVLFGNEHEMRKVYSLIYDVYRYKHVMSQALMDVSFFAYFPDLTSDCNRVWLLLFDLYVRHFIKRLPEEIDLQETLYKEADLEYISNCLWEHRVRLAAAISRLRIKSGALHLSELLPQHLQNEKVAIAAANPIVTGWMNPFKIKDKTKAILCLEKLGLSEVKDSKDGPENPLQTNQYKWDKVCPLFMSCIPNDRNKFVHSDLVRNNYFVMQDRTFSLAPAIISKLLDFFDLRGDVVQTHVSSPRSTAYLAALFYSVNRVNDFIAFGAGPHLSEYKSYITNLGIDNVRLYAENFCNIALESPVLETVVGIFATPPNSFSGVADPIDLICSRGGDLSMLEMLTESEINKEGKKRVAQLLEEQRDTLRLAMSRPQVQFILYETHSIVGSENQDMVNRAVEDINRCAFEKHLLIYKEKRKQETLAELESMGMSSVSAQSSAIRKLVSTSSKPDDVIVKFKKGRPPSSESVTSSDMSNLNTARKSNATSATDDMSQNVKVPKTDEFQISDVPDMCVNRDKCINFSSLGCYVALIRRKQITKLDAKYLIKMAEARGLFGSGDRKKPVRQKSMKRPEKRVNGGMNSAGSDTKRGKVKKTDVATLIERLNQPTHASINRSHLQKISSAETKAIEFNFAKKACGRHNKHHFEESLYNPPNPYMTALQLDTRAKRWWQETTNYVNALRSMRRTNESKKDDNSKVDNSANKSSGTNIQNKPILYEIQAFQSELPSFRLSRTHHDLYSIYQDKRSKFKSTDRIPFPVTVNRLEFNDFSSTNSSKLGNPSSFFNYPPIKEKDEPTSIKLSRRSIHAVPKPLGYFLYSGN